MTIIMGDSHNPALAGENPLKLGIFCTNTLSALTTVPELFKPTWDNCVRVAQLADAMGLEAIVPSRVGRDTLMDASIIPPTKSSTPSLTLPPSHRQPGTAPCLSPPMRRRFTPSSPPRKRPP